MQIDYKKVDSDQLFKIAFNDIKQVEFIKPKYVFKNPFKKDFDNGVVLRNWEYSVYRSYESALYTISGIVSRIFERIKLFVYRISLHPLFRKEWREENGRVVSRKYSGPFGSFRYLDGKLIKLSHRAEVYGMDAEIVIAEASSIAQDKADKKQKVKVEDAEFYALSGMKRRYTPRTSKEMEWEKNENAITKR